MFEQRLINAISWSHLEYTSKDFGFSNQQGYLAREISRFYSSIILKIDYALVGLIQRKFIEVFLAAVVFLVNDIFSQCAIKKILD